MARAENQEQIVVGLVVKNILERQVDYERYEKNGCYFFSVSFRAVLRLMKEQLENLKSAGRVILVSGGSFEEDKRVAESLKEIDAIKVYLTSERLRDWQKLSMRRLGFSIMKENSITPKMIEYLRNPQIEG